MSRKSNEVAFKAQLVLPEQRQLFEYWLERADGRQMPDRCEISPAHFPKLLPSISLIEVKNGGTCFEVRLAGTALRDLHDCEITGFQLEDFDWGGNRDFWKRTYCRLAETGRPEQGVIRGPKTDKEHLAQFWLRLPLTTGGTGVGMILCHDTCVPAIDLPEDVAVAV